MNKKIVGPVVPVPAPFKEDQSLDLDTLKTYVGFLAENGIKNIMSTVGTSRFNLLSPEEVFDFNRTLVEASGDATTIVANPPYGGIESTIRYGKAAKENGADVFLVIFPDRNYGDDLVFDFFQEIAKSVEIDIMIHEMPLRNGLGGGQKQYSLSLLERLFTIPNIIGLKEEALDLGYSPQIVKKFAKEYSIVGAGGGMSRYLRDYWLGADTYLAGIANFKPEVELEFFENMQKENFKEAYRLVHDIEMPFFKVAGPMGWHPALKEALELAGLFPTSAERKPIRRISESNRFILEKSMKENGWI